MKERLDPNTTFDFRVVPIDTTQKRQPTKSVYAPVLRALKDLPFSRGPEAKGLEIAVPPGKTPEEFRNGVLSALRRQYPELTGHIHSTLDRDKEVVRMWKVTNLENHRDSRK